MELQYSNIQELVPECPCCREKYLILLTVKIQSKNEDLLACNACKLAIFVEDFKKQLLIK